MFDIPLLPDWIPAVWATIVTGLGGVVAFLLRRTPKGIRALELAQKAYDLLAWFLAQGATNLGAAKAATVHKLEAEGVSRATAERIVEGAAEKLRGNR